MGILKAAITSLLSVSLLQGQANLVAGVGIGGGGIVEVAGGCSSGAAANPVDLSVGSDITCAVIPGGTISCWPTGAQIAPVKYTWAGEKIIQVLVSEREDSTSPYTFVAIRTESSKIQYTAMRLGGSEGITVGTWSDYAGSFDYMALHEESFCVGIADPIEVDIHCHPKTEHNPVPGGAVERTVSKELQEIFFSPSSKHMCELYNNGGLYCYGDDTNGQLGSTTPVMADAKTVAVGTTHTCAIREDNTLWCWGESFTNLEDVHDGSDVPRHLTAGDRFTCYVTNNELKCFTNGASAVVVDVGTDTVFSAWAGKNHVCVQLDDGSPAGLTKCFSMGGSISAAGISTAASSAILAAAGCAPNENCVKTITVQTPGSTDALNHDLELNFIPLQFGQHAIVEGADANSYFGLSYDYIPQQFAPPGMNMAMFAYIVPRNIYDAPDSAQKQADIDASIRSSGCVLALSDSPFGSRVNKQCFQLIPNQQVNGELVDEYHATIVMRSCIVNECDSYTSSSSLMSTLNTDLTTIYGSVGALDAMTMCPYNSVLDFTITVPVGNLVETSQAVDLKWARDDVTEADADTAESAVPINDDLSNDVEWAICDRALNTANPALDAGFDYSVCFNTQVDDGGNARVVQLSKKDSDGTLVPYNQLAMGFRLHADDRRLVSNGHLILVPEKSSLNLFHATYPLTELKTGARCVASAYCTQVVFSSLPYTIYTSEFQVDPTLNSVSYVPGSATGMQNYEVAFRGDLPKFDDIMGCGDKGATRKFCSIVMELTFSMEVVETVDFRRRLVHRRVELPMRMLGDNSGIDFPVALAVADDQDLASSSESLTTIVPAAASGLFLVAVGAAVLVRRRNQGGEDEAPAKGYDVEAQTRGRESGLVMS